MLLPQHNFHKPATLGECLEMLSSFDDQRLAGEDRFAAVQAVAGGTDVIFNMRLGLFRPQNLVSLRGLKELQNVEEQADGGLKIGAGCRLSDLTEDPLVISRFPALKAAIDAVASVHIRNMGTLGGNICLETRCWYTNNSEEWRNGRDGCFKTDCEFCHVIPSSRHCHAINNADTPLALIAYNALLTIQSSSGARETPIADFYRPDGIEHMSLHPTEIVTHVTIPPCSDRTVFYKFTPRRGMDFSLGAVAGRCDGEGEQVNRVQLILGSISSSPLVLEMPCRILEHDGLGDVAVGRAVDAIREELGELTNLYAKATYKKQLAKVLVKRAVEALREQS